MCIKLHFNFEVNILKTGTELLFFIQSKFTAEFSLLVIYKKKKINREL